MVSACITYRYKFKQHLSNSTRGALTSHGLNCSRANDVRRSAGVAVAIDPTAKRNDTAILVTPEADYGYGVKAVAEPDLEPSSGSLGGARC